MKIFINKDKQKEQKNKKMKDLGSVNLRADEETKNKANKKMEDDRADLYLLL